MIQDAILSMFLNTVAIGLCLGIVALVAWILPPWRLPAAPEGKESSNDRGS